MSEQPPSLDRVSQILRAQTRDEIESCCVTLQELRPHCKSKEALTDQIERQIKEGYTLFYLLDGEEVASCIGFRIFETLAWGKILYIDDLITREKSRKKGFGRELLTHAIEYGRLENCDQIHLDSGHHRFDAHRLYLNSGFKITCHHFVLIF